MKTQLLKPCIGLLCVMLTGSLTAQTIKEAITPLSKLAQKGYLEDVSISNDGKISALYKIGGDKKKDELFFESYAFDGNLKFLESNSVKEPKIESKPNREVTYMSAWVGGKTSFDVLSMKLRVNITKEEQKWDYKNQRFVTEKVISNETVKLKDESGRAYYGVDQYRSEETGDFIVLAYYETKDKKNPKQYVLLTISFAGDVKEKSIDITGAYSLVFCKQISEEAPGKNVGKQDFIMVMAPKKGNGDPAQYVYLHYGIKGNLKNRVDFKSPSTNLLVNSLDVKDGEVYLSGLSKKGTSPYEEIFEDYASIENPNYSGENGNIQMDRYMKAAKDEMDNFHLLKFSGNSMVFATTAPISEFKSKKKVAPGEKGGKIYTGKKFNINNFVVTPANEYLITGQLTSRANIGDLKNPQFVTAYGDVICLHFDSKGNLKAQYAIDKIFEDKKSEIFEMPQKFYVSPDGSYAYWEIMEVKGYSGYNSFLDAYYGRKTFRPRYFPRISKIDLRSASLGEFKIPGQKKFFTYNEGIFYDSHSGTATFIGRDEDHQNLWVSKVTFD